MNDRELLELAFSQYKSRNQREGVYCVRSGGINLRYGAQDHGFKPYQLKQSLRVRYISNVIGKIENVRFIHSDPNIDYFQPFAS